MIYMRCCIFISLLPFKETLKHKVYFKGDEQTNKYKKSWILDSLLKNPEYTIAIKLYKHYKLLFSINSVRSHMFTFMFLLNE